MEQIFSDSNFDEEVVKSPIPVLVDFWAPWCGPCQMMGPVVESLASELDPAKIKIGKLNVDENEEKATEYRVLSIPSFLIFKDGKVVDQLLGGMQKEKLLEMINKHI